MAETTSAVRGAEAFELVPRHPLKELHALNSALSSYALEADQWLCIQRGITR